MQHRMIDLVRKSQMSSQMMQAAARGALSVQPAEMMEILVHLALHNKVFAEQARMTLAGWDENASTSVAADPNTSAEVLGYLVSPKNLRPVTLPALLKNPAVPQKSLLEVAGTGARWVVEALLADETFKKSTALMTALQSNPRVRANELAALVNPGQGASATAPATPPVEAVAPVETAAANPEAGAAPIVDPSIPADDSEGVNEPAVEQAIVDYLKQNQSELAAAGDKPFEAVVVQEGTGIEGGTATAPVPEAPATPASPSAAGIKAGRKPIVALGDTKRDSTLQKISKLDITGRIALAMRGSKEERSILIRDSTKLVALAVLDSPKVSDGEVEKFALQKNVLEAVLRAIPMRRRFMKNYTIVRNLVFNPRTPLDISLGLMKNLLIHDLKNLSGNKEVSDTVRKLALRMFKQKMEKGGKD
ncbi:MAG: hypothetical protein HY010_02900 [Acidobacteria bacterium]|nr:hypothetical protein [Acidobacteriota bacterium]